MMESPRMYEEGAPDEFNNKDLKSVFTFTEESQRVQTLDTTLENVVDLQELINTAGIAFEAEGGPINIDNIFPASDLDLLEAGHTSSRGAVLGSTDFLDISKFVPETVQTICMTNTEDISSTTHVGGETKPIVTIKTEDLDLTACQGGRYTSDVIVAAADSYSRDSFAADSYSRDSFSDSSSKSSSPKVPIVYECRKPGRKPSAGGPVRARKREPTKNTSEYFEKRARNNVAVRKSREKAKLRQGETEGRVEHLSNENDRLQKKVDLLTKELNVLKSLFINVGASLPDNFEEILNR